MTNKEKLPGQEEEKEYPGYPRHPASEDIYNNSEEEDIDPEDTTQNKTKNDPKEPEDIDYDEYIPDEELDIPGAELDDEDEDIGSEDEENNYYSLGGDDHNDLEDDPY